MWQPEAPPHPHPPTHTHSPWLDCWKIAHMQVKCVGQTWQWPDTWNNSKNYIIFKNLWQKLFFGGYRKNKNSHSNIWYECLNVCPAISWQPVHPVWDFSRQKFSLGRLFFVLICPFPTKDVKSHTIVGLITLSYLWCVKSGFVPIMQSKTSQVWQSWILNVFNIYDWKSLLMWGYPRLLESISPWNVM